MDVFPVQTFDLFMKLKLRNQKNVQRSSIYADLVSSELSLPTYLQPVANRQAGFRREDSYSKILNWR